MPGARTVTLDRWPPHRDDVRNWRQTQRGGTRADRTLQRVTTRRPPPLAGLSPTVDTTLVADLEEATAQIVSLDLDRNSGIQALGTLLLRTESVASSKIEALEADTTAFARALHGSRANGSATAMVAATYALTTLMRSVVPGGAVALDHLLTAHRTLMTGDGAEARYAGRLRDVQNWIGGSDHSPRDAIYVPPPPDLVPGLMDDLLAFVARDDLPVLVQAAVAHAQFESIHPFTDGNGRVGRALMNVVLRRRGTTRRVVVPLASALVAHRDGYFDLLDSYREGDARPLVAMIVDAARISAHEARVAGDRLADLPGGWADRLGTVRSGSATRRLLDALPAHPILSADDAIGLVGGPQSSVYTALSRLEEAQVLRPLFDRTRNQVWAVGDILDELDALSARIAVRARLAHRARSAGAGG